MYPGVVARVPREVAREAPRALQGPPACVPLHARRSEPGFADFSQVLRAVIPDFWWGINEQNPKRIGKGVGKR